MTGVLLSEPDPEPPHTRVRMRFGPAGSPRADRGRPSGGTQSARRNLVIVDSRRFGTGELLLGQEALEGFFTARLGLEPLEEGFTSEHLRALARNRTAPIKALLLDQRRIAGVGNIYTDEALHRAGIHPLRPAGRLSAEQYAALRQAVVEALLAGIDARGATIDDYRHLDGVEGSFQDQFLVYGRAGEPCLRCGSTIVKMVVAGRGTYVCETCQPPPRAARRALTPRAARPAGRQPPRPAPR